MKNVRTVLDTIRHSEKMPSLPQVLLKLIEACNNNDITSKELSKIISRDPSLSAKVMRMLHSPYSGLNNRVNSIEQAVIYLGIDAIKNIATSASIQQVFSHVNENALFRLNHFWWHSFMCATLARRIAKKASLGSPEEAFLAGLLHDIGKLLLWANFPEDYSNALSQTGKNDALPAAEKAIIGASHCEVGAWLVKKWKLNASIFDAVHHHHDPPQKIDSALPLTKILYAANQLSEGFFEEKSAARKTAKAVFDFSASDMDEITDGVKQEVTDVARSLDILLKMPEGGKKVVEKQKELSREVRDISLLHGTLQNLVRADNPTAILESTQNGLEILFGKQRSVFFLNDPEHQLLTGTVVPHDSQHPINNFTISSTDDDSLIVRALENQKALDSFEILSAEKQGLSDGEVIRRLGSKGILCIPLRAHRKAIGVMVMGLSPLECRRLSKQLNVLNMLANHAAWCLHVDTVQRNREKLLHAERMQACLKFAREIVHEVNNPLSIIKNYLKILGLKLPAGSDAPADLKIIGEEINRVSELIDNLCNFSKPEIRNCETLDINLLLSNLLKILSEAILIPSKIEVRFVPDAHLPQIVSDKNGLTQIFLNLIKNAAEAMPSGGSLTICSRSTQPADFGPRESGRRFPSGITVTVRDNGPGIPEHIRQHLFEPLNSTKGAGHSGLGLSIAHSIIRELNGFITCESRENAGTSFNVILPLSTNNVQ